MPPNRQVPLEVTQGVQNVPEGPPVFIDEDVPEGERAGVPADVWDTNRRNAESYGFDVPTDNVKDTSKVNPETQPSVPDDWTRREQARAAALGEQKLAAEREAGNTFEQQLEAQTRLVQAATPSKRKESK